MESPEFPPQRNYSESVRIGFRLLIRTNPLVRNRELRSPTTVWGTSCAPRRLLEPLHELVAEGSDFSVLPARSLGAEIVVALLLLIGCAAGLHFAVCWSYEKYPCHGSALPAAPQPTIEDKKPTPAKSGSRQVPNSFSPLAFHADAPPYIPGAKTRIPAEPVTCEHICDST